MAANGKLCLMKISSCAMLSGSCWERNCSIHQ